MKNTSGRRYAYLALGLIVIAWLVMDFNGRMSQLRRITAEQEEHQRSDATNVPNRATRPDGLARFARE